MEAITIGQLWTVIVAVCAGLGSIIGVYKFLAERINKKQEQREKELHDQLNIIKKQNEELKEQMVMVMKLTLTMAEELQAKGHVNGETNAALHELKNLIYKK